MTLEQLNETFASLTMRRRLAGTMSEEEIELYQLFLSSDVPTRIASNFANLKKNGAALSAKDLIIAGLLIGYQIRQSEEKNDLSTLQ